MNPRASGDRQAPFSLLAVALMMITSAASAEGLEVDPKPLQEIVVIGSTPLPGTGIDVDKVPGNVQLLSDADLARQGSASLLTALNANLSSININDNLDDPFQPDILYRGFEASPVLGTPQGLAVYQNGVRINEAFGDTVNWDLFPDIAISQVKLVSASPVYGLNALGGAISVTMKNGFSYDGADVELSGGSYGNRALAVQAGLQSGVLGVYIAGKALDWDGWRDFSGDRIRTLYAVASLKTQRASLDLSFTRADNTLIGASSTPVQELAVNRSLVFTGPQKNLDSLDFLTLNGSLSLADGWSLQALAYYRSYAQTVANGNTSNYVACANLPATLCQPDGFTPVTNAAGQLLPDISAGGAHPLGENDFELLHAWGRGIALQVSDSESRWGLDNQFSLGATLDYAAASFYTGAQLGVIDAQLIVQPSQLIVDTPENSPAALSNGDAVPVSVDSVNKNLGVFATDTFDILPNLSLTLSGRYNITHIDLIDQLGKNLSGNNRYVHFNPAIGIAYQELSGVTLYGGVSTNTRAPTASEIECSNPSAPCLLPNNLSGDPPNLRQVIAHTSEFGVRGKSSEGAGRRGDLSWNVGLFRTLLHDDIYGIATSLSQGFFQNIGGTRRQGIEAGFSFERERWSGFANYSLVQATFRSALLVPASSNPRQDSQGDIQVLPDDRLPGIPEHRVKVGGDWKLTSSWRVGGTINWVSSAYYVGDEANLLAPLPSYATVSLHSSFKPNAHLELFASVSNLFNRRYATWGILSDPTGVGAPGIPANGVSNGPGIDNRFQSPAPPIEAFAGMRIRL